MNSNKVHATLKARVRRTRRGGAVLETALVLGILLNLAFGTVEFGDYFYIKNTLQGAAREGARAGIVPTAVNTDVTNAASTVLYTAGLIATNNAAGLTAKGFTIAIRNDTDTANLNVSGLAAGTGVLVKVYTTWGSVGLRPLGLIGTAKVVLGTTVMRKEG